MNMSKIPEEYYQLIQRAKENDFRHLDVRLWSHTQELLTHLPEELFEVESLTSLDLGHNLLTSIPDSISRLRNLYKLDLGSNKFNSFPNSILQLQNLKH